jgi:hypothetical protein
MIDKYTAKAGEDEDIELGELELQQQSKRPQGMAPPPPTNNLNQQPSAAQVCWEKKTYNELNHFRPNSSNRCVTCQFGLFHAPKELEKERHTKAHNISNGFERNIIISAYQSY